MVSLNFNKADLDWTLGTPDVDDLRRLQNIQPFLEFFNAHIC